MWLTGQSFWGLSSPASQLPLCCFVLFWFLTWGDNGWGKVNHILVCTWLVLTVMKILFSLYDWLLDPLRMLTSPPANVLLGSHSWKIFEGWGVLRRGKHRADHLPAGHAECGPHFCPDSYSHLWLAMCFLGFAHSLTHSIHQKGSVQTLRSANTRLWPGYSPAHALPGLLLKIDGPFSLISF